MRDSNIIIVGIVRDSNSFRCLYCLSFSRKYAAGRSVDTCDLRAGSSSTRLRSAVGVDAKAETSRVQRVGDGRNPLWKCPRVRHEPARHIVPRHSPAVVDVEKRVPILVTSVSIHLATAKLSSMAKTLS